MLVCVPSAVILMPRMALVITGVKKKASSAPTSPKIKLAVDLLSPRQKPIKKPMTSITINTIETIQPIALALIIFLLLLEVLSIYMITNICFDSNIFLIFLKNSIRLK